MSKLEPLRAAVAVSPDNVPLLLLLAQACLDEWSLDEGRDTFERVLRIEPARMEAKLGIAKILHLSGKISEAIVRTESITRENPDYAAAWIFLSRLNVVDGNREQAQANYEQALKLDPSSKDASLERELFSGGMHPEPSRDEPEKVPVTGDSWKGSDDESNGPKPADIETPKTNFADVGGMDAVKEEIRMKIIYPLKNPELFRAYGKKIGGGVLLYGPPGCGKTMLSRATAGEISANFISIGIHQILDLYLGNSEKTCTSFSSLRATTPPPSSFSTRSMRWPPTATT